MDYLLNTLLAAWHIVVETAPFLLAGLFLVGLIHMIMPNGLVRRYAAAGKKRGIFLTSLIGVPMPLCSCGVLPFAASLRKEGAGRGATVAFLTSTPQTGVDSILVSYSFFGPIFALFKAVWAFISGVSGGLVTGMLPEEKAEAKEIQKNGIKKETQVGIGGFAKFKEMLLYGFGKILGDIAPTFLFGVLIAGVITVALPANSLGKLSPAWLYYPAVLLFSIPFYICSTSSVPLAFALVMKGLPPGAALVFLIAGPATNAATIGVIAKTLGKKSALVYLLNIAIFSVLGGLLFDGVFSLQKSGYVAMHAGHDADWLSLVAGAVLLLLSLFHLTKKITKSYKKRRKVTCTSENGACCTKDK